MQRDDLKRETSINEREPDLKHQGYKVRASHIREADEALQSLHICFALMKNSHTNPSSNLS